MGGCAAKPKAVDPVPPEPPTTAEDPVVVSPQEGENEAPLLGVSEPKEGGEEKPSELEAADATNVPEEAAEKVNAKTEPTVETTTEGGVEAKVVVEESKAEGTEAAGAPAPAPEVKTDEPPVTA